MLRRPVESALTASVRVVHQPVEVVAFAVPGPDRLFQRVQHQLGGHRGPGAPAQDSAGVGIHDERDVDPPRPRRHVGDVGHPQPVRRQRRKPATDQVLRPPGCPIGDRGPLHRPAPDTFQTGAAHEPFDGAARDRDALAVELQPDLAGPVDTKVRVVDSANLHQQGLIALDTLARELVAPLVIRRWGDLHAMLAEHLPDRLDTPPQPLRVTPVGVLADEVDDH